VDQLQACALTAITMSARSVRVDLG
jgi:hypothetical protein